MPQSTPIVNVGDITYASGLVSSTVEVPTLSEIGLVLLVLSLLLAGWRTLAPKRQA